MEGLEICLLNNNSRFATLLLLHTNGTAPGALNSCSYSNIAISHLDKLLMKRELPNFRNAFILVYIMMTIWFYDTEILRK